MKKKTTTQVERKKKLFSLPLAVVLFGFGLFCLLFHLGAPPLHAETVGIPGDVNAISFYTKFFYNLPNDDFIYYLNDRFLFSEAPDGKLTPNGKREELRKIILVHKSLTDYMREINGNDKKSVTINLKDSQGQTQAEDMLSLLGLYLDKTKDGKFQIYVDDSTGVIDYYKFMMLDINTMMKQINKTGLLHFNVVDSTVNIPWDISFLNEITGLSLEPSNFFPSIIEDENLSLLLGLLFRLADKEIDFIGTSIQSPGQNAWQTIYQDKPFLTGLFVLAPALRIKDNQLQIPGGNAAETFWTTLVGANCRTAPLEFLKNLATLEDGKYNYLYTFSFFLPENSIKALFFDYDAGKVKELLSHVELKRNAKIGASYLPELPDYNFYTLLYSLIVEDGKIRIPGGVTAWINAIGIDIQNPNNPGSATSEPGTFDLLKGLLEESQKSRSQMTALQKFMSIYNKFRDRPGLLNKEVIAKLYNNYEEYNILIDFIEKIPVQKSETVIRLFDWLDNFGRVNQKDRLAYTAIFQSLLEIFSYCGKYAPEKYDYDYLVSELISIPMTKQVFADNLFNFFKNSLKISLNSETIDQAFINFVLSGIENRNIHFNNLDYRYMAKELYRDIIKKIQLSQETSSLSVILDTSRLLDTLVEHDMSQSPGIEERIHETFLQLPHHDIGEGAPKQIKERVIAYSRSALDNDLKDLIQAIKKKESKEELKKITAKIKKKYIFPHLQDYFLSIAYALNAKDPKLRIFINPNLVRLHDFDDESGHTCWNFSGRPRSKVLTRKGAGLFGNEETATFSGYYLRGGLSRLNIVFSNIWKDHLFGRNVIFDPNHVKGFTSNLLDLYPVPASDQNHEFIAMTIDLALELLQKSRQEEYKNIRPELIDILGRVTTGYHYREVMDYLDNRSSDYYLFFNELQQLGEQFFKQGKHLEKLAATSSLSPSRKMRFKESLSTDRGLSANIYYHTFGNLKPIRAGLFPQEVSNLLGSGWTSGEMLDEFKVKVAYHAYKKGIPGYLIGEFIYQYFTRTTPRYYSQNYRKDYFSGYFIFDIFNNSYMNRIIKKAKEKGYLQVR